METPLELSQWQFDLVYNAFSFVIAAMGASLVFFLLVRSRLPERHRMALTLSTLVVGIALYHYLRIFASWDAAFTLVNGVYVESGRPFNEGYRYVDWLLTVPLLLFEIIAVLALPRATRAKLLTKLIPASILMIALGYPGEIIADTAPKLIWGALSTIPFLYILYVLFVELTKSLDRQPPEVAASVRRLRLLLIATWGVYPISYLFPVLGLSGTDAFVARQVGYSVADVLAKCLFGLVIYKIARMKSAIDDPAFGESEFAEAPSTGQGTERGTERVTV